MKKKNLQRGIDVQQGGGGRKSVHGRRAYSVTCFAFSLNLSVSNLVKKRSRSPQEKKKDLTAVHF